MKKEVKSNKIENNEKIIYKTGGGRKRSKGGYNRDNIENEY